MHLIRTALSLILLLRFGVALSADGYICTVDQATGFSFKKATGQWSVTTFRSDKKLLLTRADARERGRGAVWVVKYLGEDIPSFRCDADFVESGSLLCQGFGEFRFNRKTLRFLSTYTAGYYADGLPARSPHAEEGANTPSIAIGRCTSL